MMDKVEYHLGTVRTGESMFNLMHAVHWCNMTIFIVSGPVEYDPEYQLIVESNNMVVEIDNEICR